MSAKRLAMMSAEIRSQLLALLSPATRLIVVARITAPSTNDNRAWRNAVARMVRVFKSVVGYLICHTECEVGDI